MKEQMLEGAVNLFKSGVDIKTISANLKIPVSEIEEYINSQDVFTRFRGNWGLEDPW